MRANPRSRTIPPVRDDYLDLIRRFPLRPIRSRAEHRGALAIGMELSALGSGHRLTQGQNDYFTVLAQIVAEYERVHVLPALATANPLDVLRHLMEEHGLTPAALGDILGSRPAATMILNGQREMSKAHIRAAAAYFGVSPAVFL